jgi:hypothetical protein
MGMFEFEKRRIVVGFVFCAITAVLAIAFLEDSYAQGWRDGYKNADQIIKNKCLQDWPQDFVMQKYCIDQQNEALAKLKIRTSANTPKGVFVKCEREWHYDFQMREYCIQEQVKSMNALNKSNPEDIPPNVLQMVRGKCAREWADDFQMREYCENEQFKAFRSLR